MAISYRPYEPQQEMLLPASLQDWLPKGYLAYFCRRRSNIDPPCRSNTDPGMDAGRVTANCGQV